MYRPTTDIMEELERAYYGIHAKVDEELMTARHKAFLARAESFLTRIRNDDKEAFRGMVEARRSSVEELKKNMGEAYKDFSIQVAYKEGYNAALKSILDTLGREG